MAFADGMYAICIRKRSDTILTATIEFLERRDVWWHNKDIQSAVYNCRDCDEVASVKVTKNLGETTLKKNRGDTSSSWVVWKRAATTKEVKII